MSGALPKEITDFLAKDYHVITFRCGKNTDIDTIKEVMEQVIEEKIVPKYETNVQKVRKNTLLDCLTTPFRAAKKYNEKGQDILFDMYISSKGLVTAYSNGTELLKQKDIKNCLENRQKLPAMENDKDGLDADFLFLVSDLIQVDIKEGILYFGLTKEFILD